MIDFSTYKLRGDDLKLIRFDFNFRSSDAYDVIYDILNNDEKRNVGFITTKYPNSTSDLNDEQYWDILLLDNEVLFYLENMLVKYGIVYTITDITDQYIKKSKKLEKDFIEEIDNYVEKLYDVDQILDRINEVGLDKINKFELNYLQKQSKK
jgi:hypothetical protein